MKILVTGANGFIGRALCKRLFADNWRVHGAVRSSNQFNKLPSKVNIFQVGSIGPETDWTKALEGVDAVVHLAARVHVINNTVSDTLAK